MRPWLAATVAASLCAGCAAATRVDEAPTGGDTGRDALAASDADVSVQDADADLDEPDAPNDTWTPPPPDALGDSTPEVTPDALGDAVPEADAPPCKSDGAPGCTVFPQCGCPTGQACSPGGGPLKCELAGTVPIGGACAKDPTTCAPGSGCFSTTKGTICLKWCRVTMLDCPAGTACAGLSLGTFDGYEWGRCW